jgi:release factor glutamine methyltransferase
VATPRHSQIALLIADQQPARRSDVVARLRAAGCVFAEDEARLLVAQAQTPADLESMVDSRVAGLPLEQILGWAMFCGLRIAVEPGVFVPRRRTEHLARTAIALARPGVVVVDLCCGTGAVGAAVAAAVSGVDLTATDIDPVAVECAHRNLAPYGAAVLQGDLYDALPLSLVGRVDLLVANAPYVPTAEIAWMPPEARDHEPHRALDGGADGLAWHRRIAAGARRLCCAGVRRCGAQRDGGHRHRRGGSVVRSADGQ